MALKDEKREDLDNLAREKGLDPAAYSNKDDLVTALENAGVTDDPALDGEQAEQAVTETDTPRDPSQAIPEVALPRYLDTNEAGQASNPQQ